MVVKANSIEGSLADFPVVILTMIVGDPTGESLIKIHQLINGNASSMALNLRGGRHVHLTLENTSKEYTAQTGYAFVPPHNPGDCPPTKGTAQEKVLGTERFQQNHAIFRRYTAM